MKELKRVDLRGAGLHYPALLVPADSGVVYSNQVRGVYAERRELEGYLVPMGVNASGPTNPKWWDGRKSEVDEHVVRELEHLKWGPSVIGLKVDTSKRNVEAWVYVSVRMADPQGENTIRAVLTWENSD